jgi:hypothetical protein
MGSEPHPCEAELWDGSRCGKPVPRVPGTALFSFKGKNGVMDSYGKAYWFCEPHRRAILRRTRELRATPQWDGR